MLRFDRIEFEYVRPAAQDTAPEIRATLRLRAGRLIHRSGPDDGVKDELRLDVWRLAYGEIQGPVRELISLAKIYVRPEDQAHLRKLSDEIIRLIGPPVPLPDEFR